MNTISVYPSFLKAPFLVEFFVYNDDFLGAVFNPEYLSMEDFLFSLVRNVDNCTDDDPVMESIFHPSTEGSILYLSDNSFAITRLTVYYCSYLAVGSSGDLFSSLKNKICLCRKF